LKGFLDFCLMRNKWYFEPVKRLMDIAFSLILMVLFLPVWLVIPILIVLDSPGPIIYRHRRIGRGGKEFWMYKFRSMVDNADEILFLKNRKLLQKFKDGDWKLEKDPRITQLGRIMRSITIDEFPQLFNVLKGEMSLVGPRAYVKEELKEQQKKYPETRPWIKDILTIKPGITGPWQTSGRNIVPFNVRAKMDAKYARKRSILEDIIIILKTPVAMFSKW
jgi:lipopolysaccharide/colanic/teichoic acid biosynthesis glycosyltransferase